MAYGALGFLGINKQNSWGTTIVASLMYNPIISEGLPVKIEPLYDEGIRARYSQGPTYEGLESIEGDISMLPHPIGIGHFLRGIMGQVVTTSITAAQQHVFIPRNDDFDIYTPLPPYTLEMYRGVGDSWQFTDGIFPKMELSIAGGQLVKTTIGAKIRTSSLMAKNTPTFPTDVAWTWNVTSLTIGGIAVSNFSEINISFENPVAGEILLNNTKRWGRFARTGMQDVKISGVMLFDTQSEYIEFKTQTERRLLVNLGYLTTSLNTMLIDIPKMRYIEYPVTVEGPGIIKVSFSADGKYDTTSNYALKITLLNSQTWY